jgi:hypothetical protein
MPQSLTYVGGARIGWFNATWPFAKLSVEGNVLVLKVRPFGTYTFTSQQVFSLERYGFIPVLAWGVRINHVVPGYPKKIVFWCFGNPGKLIQDIRKTGFTPSPESSAASVSAGSVKRHGFPVRWQPILVLIVIWNLLLLKDMGPEGLKAEPGILTFIALLMVFLISVGIRMSDTMQKIFLKEGREVKEIEVYLNFFIVLTGLMLSFFSVGIITQ